MKVIAIRRHEQFTDYQQQMVHRYYGAKPVPIAPAQSKVQMNIVSSAENLKYDWNRTSESAKVIDNVMVALICIVSIILMMSTPYYFNINDIIYSRMNRLLYQLVLPILVPSDMVSTFDEIWYFTCEHIVHYLMSYVWYPKNRSDLLRWNLLGVLRALKTVYPKTK